MTNATPNRLSAILASSLMALAMTAGSAAAQPADPAQMLARADANDDGDVSWDEVTTLRSDSFQKLDRNKDGVVNANDSPPRPLAGRFNQAFARLQADFDTDRDGQVTEDELLNAPAPLFEKGDVDGDGVLTAEEMATLRADASSVTSRQ